jgi:hypothetical protein
MNESDQPTQPSTGQPSTEPTNGASGGDGASASGSTAREMLGQLQSIIDNLATQAAPVVREIGAKAAEIAAIAAEKAGPIAQKTADVTQEAGTKLAERAREVAAELRRDVTEPEGTTGSTTTATTMDTRSDDPAEGRPDVGP